ncbi:hypothetical protein DFH27DRAFT_639036 [Peziza echinospora]|nr:hypothetical protein DFH27DRAFT_639036 [Peziza echinospora]
MSSNVNGSDYTSSRTSIHINQEDDRNDLTVTLTLTQTLAEADAAAASEAASQSVMDSHPEDSPRHHHHHGTGLAPPGSPPQHHYPASPYAMPPSTIEVPVSLYANPPTRGFDHGRLRPSPYMFRPRPSAMHEFSLTSRRIGPLRPGPRNQIPHPHRTSSIRGQNSQAPPSRSDSSLGLDSGPVNHSPISNAFHLPHYMTRQFLGDNPRAHRLGGRDVHMPRIEPWGSRPVFPPRRMQTPPPPYQTSLQQHASTSSVEPRHVPSEKTPLPASAAARARSSAQGPSQAPAPPPAQTSTTSLPQLTRNGAPNGSQPSSPALDPPTPPASTPLPASPPLTPSLHAQPGIPSESVIPDLDLAAPDPLADDEYDEDCYDDDCFDGDCFDDDCYDDDCYDDDYYDDDEYDDDGDCSSILKFASQGSDAMQDISREHKSTPIDHETRNRTIKTEKADEMSEASAEHEFEGDHFGCNQADCDYYDGIRSHTAIKSVSRHSWDHDKKDILKEERGHGYRDIDPRCIKTFPLPPPPQPTDIPVWFNGGSHTQAPSLNQTPSSTQGTATPTSEQLSSPAARQRRDDSATRPGNPRTWPPRPSSPLRYIPSWFRQDRSSQAPSALSGGINTPGSSSQDTTRHTSAAPPPIVAEHGTEGYNAARYVPQSNYAPQSWRGSAPAPNIYPYGSGNPQPAPPSQPYFASWHRPPQEHFITIPQLGPPARQGGYFSTAQTGEAQMSMHQAAPEIQYVPVVEDTETPESERQNPAPEAEELEHGVLAFSDDDLQMRLEPEDTMAERNGTMTIVDRIVRLHTGGNEALRVRYVQALTNVLNRIGGLDRLDRLVGGSLLPAGPVVDRSLRTFITSAVELFERIVQREEERALPPYGTWGPRRY